MTSVLLAVSSVGRRVTRRHVRNDPTTHWVKQEKWLIGMSMWQYLYGSCGDVTSDFIDPTKTC